MELGLFFDKNADIDRTSFLSPLDHPYSFNEGVARLYSLANYNIFEEGDQHKLSFELSGRFNDEVFSLSDYKEDNMINIGGHFRKLDVELLKKYLLKIMKATAPKEFEASYHYYSEDTYSWP